MSADLLCFREAHDARLKGEIDLEEFLRHIVAHYGGLRHHADGEGESYYIPGPSGFEDEVRDIVLRDSFQALEDDNVAIIYSIFLGGFQGDSTTVRNLVDSFNIGSEHYLRPLTQISIASGDPQLLRVCLEKGYLDTCHRGYDSDDLLKSRVDNNPSTEWLDVLFDLDFRQWRTNPDNLSTDYSWRTLVFMGADCTRWWIEHGGRAPKARGLFWINTGEAWPGAPPIKALLDQFGVDWFTDSGALQLAACKNDFETVRMLLDAGADVNEHANYWKPDIREYAIAPLTPLQQAMYRKSEEMIRYLVEHGAKLSRKDLHIPDTWNTFPKEFWPSRDLIVELGAVKEETTL